MGFNSAFKGLKLLKPPGNGRLHNLNDSVLNVLISLLTLVRNLHLGTHLSGYTEVTYTTVLQY